MGRTISNCNKVLIVKIGFGIAQCPSPAAYFQARNQLSLKLAVENINQPWFDISYMFLLRRGEISRNVSFFAQPALLFKFKNNFIRNVLRGKVSK